MIIKLDHIISSVFALLATWIIFAATPFFRLNGMYPQVDTQIIILHGICALMFFYQAILLVLNKYELRNFNNPLIILPFFLAILGLISSIFTQNFNTSLSGSPQIGQGVFWYFDLTIMLVIFSQVAHFKIVRLLLFSNLMIITSIVTFFTFFPFWNGIPISFYFFTDYLCFYGVLNFILFTTLTKKPYLNFFAFLILGLYLSLLDNRAATLFWSTTFSAGIGYYTFKNIQFLNKKKFLNLFFSDSFFVFTVFVISLLTLLSSLYFWSTDFNLPKEIKGTILDAPVVRGKIIENSLYGLNSFKSLLFGNGWGAVPSLLLENMNSWQYDELRLGYNLHFHTHNELAEHLVSIGLIGGILYLLFVYYIFQSAKNFNFESKLGWFLFFKIMCFWFLWTGTLTLFASVLSCFVLIKEKKTAYLTFLNNNSKSKNFIFTFIFFLIGFFLIYGSYITFITAKTNSLLNYSNIIERKTNKDDKNIKCLDFYNDFNRGGIVLDRFLQGYSSHLFSLEVDEIKDQDLYVLKQLQCKANQIIKDGKYSSSLLNISMQADTQFYFKYKDTILEKRFIQDNYDQWFQKALIMSKQLPGRGDLIMPFLSYAISNKNEDALKVCKQSVRGLEAICDLIKANQLLVKNDISQTELNKSILLINKAIKKGIFSERVYGFWINQEQLFQYYGLKGIPLSPDILFLISDREKIKLEKIIRKSK